MPDGAIVVLTGSGLSTESGLQAFRDREGAWRQVRLEDVATPEGYRRNPMLVHAFYNDRRRRLESGEARPNPAHLALARLQREWPGEVMLVTQNIDDLHERAGSEDVVHMHGELLKARCDLCGGVFGWSGDITPESRCLGCQHKGRLRPHVVWFGEMPFAMPRILEVFGRCALFLSIGSAGNVYPAAGFVTHLRSRGGVRTVELNVEPSLGASLFHETIYGPASEVVPRFVDMLLAEAL